MTENPSIPDNGPDDQQQQKPREPRPHPEKGPVFAAAESPAHDLSEEIVKTVKRTAGERVTCRRIFGNNYRCNWWTPQSSSGYDNPNLSGSTVTTHRVGRSALLRVMKTPEGNLSIEIVNGAPR
ncbi:MAG TPA: hypothetical protein VGR35_08890 [Tepidisphaeraceae bacterium]|nr:hypothetical protein [Tepidisphaeraceae bacterium]